MGQRKKEGNFKLRVGDKEIINEDFNQDGLKGKGNNALLNSVKKHLRQNQNWSPVTI